MNYRPSNFLEGVDLDGRTKAVRETIKRITANRDKMGHLDAVEIAFSKTMNNLLTLILSNALGDERPVLSPNRTVPVPGKVTIGLILA